jgi:UPF0271 protein
MPETLLKQTKRTADVDTVFVIDSSVIFLRKVHDESVTIPEVIEEVKDENSRLYLSLLDLRVEEASEESIGEVKKAARRTGDIYKLSETDIKLIAKALDEAEKGKKPVLVTDDYSIQNVALLLGIEVETVIQPGISKAFKWIKVCRGCGREVSEDVCPVCGSEVIVKRVKKKRVRRRRE